MSWEIRLNKNINSNNLPDLIVTNIEGCLAPSGRGNFDLDSLEKVRQYCEFRNTHTNFPSIVMCTGRSQGYIECLIQILGLAESSNTQKTVIEMGAAIYNPQTKSTTNFLKPEEREIITQVKNLLPEEEFCFEPKSYILTINPRENENILQLEERISRVLKGRKYQGYSGYYQRLYHLDSCMKIYSGRTAIDIVPVRHGEIGDAPRPLSKYDSLSNIIFPDFYTPGAKQGSFVCVADSESDIDLIRNASRSFCSKSCDTPKTVLDIIEEDSKVDKEGTEVFIEVLRLVCGVEFLEKGDC